MPKLKRLEVQGYKTFASKTEFLFDEGITAIIGPNGSGKSNIADAIRWALGEQSYRSLRGRQTADMIFHGSQQRPRLGMASVTLTLDNDDSWMSTDFQEVAVARRAYRSGENEYVLNGNRVRLRDVVDVLGPTGLGQRTYTVIGQGLVDTALSLRPEERRLLFEEAAGIAGHKEKREEAMDRLEQTKANLVRVHDILSEIGPRLKRLETQAQRAQEFARVHADLRDRLRTWHGHRWQTALDNLKQARDKEVRSRQLVEERRSEAAGMSRRMTALQENQAAIRHELVEWQRKSDDLHRQAEAMQRGLAVRQERRRQLDQRLDDVERESAGLRARLRAQMERATHSERELSDLESLCHSQSAEVTEAKSGFETQQAAFQQQQVEVNRLQAAVLDSISRLAEYQQQQQQAETQRQRLVEQLGSHQAAVGAARAEVERRTEDLKAISTEIATLQETVAELKLRRSQQAGDLSAAQLGRQNAVDRVAAATREESQLQDRLDLLIRLQSEGEGYAAGVRAVLRGHRRGVIGPVAECFRVPAKLESVIEAALGSRLQDLVVEKWSDAEAAIAWLDREGAGRATFLPLDSLRPPPPMRAPEERGVVGLASELIEADQDVRRVMDVLLGRTLVVEDLPSASRLLRSQMLDALPSQIVTLGGEIVRSDGRVSGGHGGSTNILARERERRELPGLVSDAAQHTEVARQALARAEENITACQNSLVETDLRRQQVDRSLEARVTRQSEAQRPLDLAVQREGWYRDLLAQAEADLLRIQEDTTGMEAAIEQLLSQQAQHQTELAAAQESLAVLDASALQARFTALEAELALQRSRRDGMAALLAGQHDAIAELEQQLEAKRTQAGNLREQLSQLAVETEVHSEGAGALAEQLREITSLIDPAKEELDQLSTEQMLLERNERAIQLLLREEELRASQSLLSVEQSQAQLHTLLREIEVDLGPVKPAHVESLAFLQPVLPLPLPVEDLPAVHDLPPGVEADIRRLRRLERRMDNVNPNAPTEYAETLERHRFLEEQVSDLEKASGSLHEVIVELDALMERELEHTITAIAGQFKEYFTTLFDGGSARLELTDPKNLTQTGVEIIARPPGKRTQSLALLSGGERSLTAIALIFAILKVSPPPFCVLDEVDAMLDEANVGRFRRLLKDLSQNTQFIVITHNRHTIEAADTIYGVSMGADSVSQVVSLRLHGEQIKR